MKILTAAAIALSAVCAIDASADKTTRRGLKAAPVKTERTVAATADTLVPSPGMIELSGYDKPLRSSKESLYITNATRRTLVGAVIEISYFDAAGRLLHKRSVTVNATIPPQETRLATFPSWDKQHTMFYHRTGKPRTADGTSYSITAIPLTAIYTR